MFQPAHFREERTEVMHALMRAEPLATLATVRAGSLLADHVPMTIHEDTGTLGTLRGHIAKANPLCRDDTASCEAIVIFQGPQTYITPSWYASKAEHGKAVPTWNYVVAHARGRLNFTSDEAWLLAHLTELTQRHERLRPEPWTVSDAPPDYIGRQLKGIVGIELEIQTLQGQWKVSQNKDDRDRAGIISGLRQEGRAEAEAVANLVKAPA